MVTRTGISNQDRSLDGGEKTEAVEALVFPPRFFTGQCFEATLKRTMWPQVGAQWWSLGCDHGSVTTETTLMRKGRSYPCR